MIYTGTPPCYTLFILISEVVWKAERNNCIQNRKNEINLHHIWFLIYLVSFQSLLSFCTTGLRFNGRRRMSQSGMPSPKVKSKSFHPTFFSFVLVSILFCKVLVGNLSVPIPSRIFLMLWPLLHPDSLPSGLVPSIILSLHYSNNVP